MFNSIFAPAINWMHEENSIIYGPKSFQDYIREYNLPRCNTASNISVDSYEKLNPLLKTENVMVFRLGKSGSSIGTQFALRKVDNVYDYFIVDNEVFTDSFGIEIDVSEINLLPYKILHNLTETSFVSLALNSGILAKALDVEFRSFTATCQSTYTFNIKLHSDDDEAFFHSKGQVEIDSLFVSERKGKQILFVVEAKLNETHKSLAKHKLVYPLKSVATSVPKDIEIVPIYLKVKRSVEFLHFHILECKYPDPRLFDSAINELTPKKYTHFKIRF